MQNGEDSSVLSESFNFVDTSKQLSKYYYVLYIIYYNCDNVTPTPVRLFFSDRKFLKLHTNNVSVYNKSSHTAHKYLNQQTIYF